jgi:hypothetical protein
MWRALRASAFGGNGGLFLWLVDVGDGRLGDMDSRWIDDYNLNNQPTYSSSPFFFFFLEDIDWLAFGYTRQSSEALAEHRRPFPWAFEAVLGPLEAMAWLALSFETLDKALEALDE